LVFRWFAGEVAEGEAAAFDDAVRAAVHSVGSPWLTTVFKAISFTGKVAVLTGFGAAAVAVLAYFRRWRDITLVLVTMAGEIFLELTLKDAYRRVRPAPYFDLPPAESYSFPSGHALGSLCFYGIIAFVICRRVEDRFTRIAIAALAAVWVFAIGLSRVYLGMHYPSDVAGGFFVGAIWLGAVLVAERSIARPADAD
jgi:undecaprenyl-diphosphatase